MQRATRMYRRLGIEAPEPRTAADYREYVEERIDEYLGFDVLALPGTDHADLVRRAVNRIPPFDSKGSGFRDSLLWGNVVELAVEAPTSHSSPPTGSSSATTASLPNRFDKRSNPSPARSLSSSN